MVADLLEFNGWDTVYLGASTPHASIASMVCQHHADVVALSVTMTYHLGPLEEAIRTIRSTPGCERTRILVGGRPFLLEPDLWRELGADGSARDAREAVVLANELTARRPQTNLRNSAG
jgi:methanogenic corrinoid protein MtbC1